MTRKREITPDDIVPIDEYSRIRADKRRELLPVKKRRRLPVGPDATFYFESYETMWLQVHEMLFIEKGGDEQVPDELAAYNPLIPKGRELIATVMFEVDDPVRRKAFLGGLGGVEDHMTLDVAGDVVRGQAEADVDRTTADGKASSVQFVHFSLNERQADALKQPGTRVMVGIDHPNYGHLAVVPEESRAELSRDLD